MPLYCKGSYRLVRSSIVRSLAKAVATKLLLVIVVAAITVNTVPIKLIISEKDPQARNRTCNKYY
jgi:hypothetical protein